jgi:putative tricarboxylic transport membrane protein
VSAPRSIGRRRAIVAAAGCVASSAFGAPATWPAGGGTLELIVPSGPSGGLDIAARAMSRIIDTEKLIATPSIVVNKPGAGGVIAYQYLRLKRGDPRYYAIGSPAVMTNRLMGVGDVDHRDLTPICGLFVENIVFMVRADSPLQTGKDLLARLSRDPGSVPWGIATAYGGSNHIAVASMMKSARIDIRKGMYVVYKSGGDALIALLGGQVDIVPVAAPATLSALASGKVRLIAVSSERRLEGVLADVPTWREQGVDAVYMPWRVMFGPPDLAERDVTAAARVFVEMQGTAEWTAQLQKNHWVRDLRTTEATRRYMDTQWAEHRELLGELGLNKL